MVSYREGSLILTYVPWTLTTELGNASPGDGKESGFLPQDQGVSVMARICTWGRAARTGPIRK